MRSRPHQLALTHPEAVPHGPLGPQGCTSPAACAYAAASVRVSAPSFARMWETWTLAVFGEMNSRVAIAQFVAPAATRQSTSRSRSVSEATFCSARAEPADGIGAPGGSSHRLGRAGRTARAASRARPRGRRASRATTCSRAATRSRRSRAGASPDVRAPLRRARGRPGRPSRRAGRRSVWWRVGRCSCPPDVRRTRRRVVRVGTLRFGRAGDRTLRNERRRGSACVPPSKVQVDRGGVEMSSRLYERTAEIAAIDSAVSASRRRSRKLPAAGGPGRSRQEHARWSTPCRRGRERGARTWVVRARHLTSAAPVRGAAPAARPSRRGGRRRRRPGRRVPVRDPVVHAGRRSLPRRRLRLPVADRLARRAVAARAGDRRRPLGRRRRRCACCSTSRRTSRSSR